MTNPACPDWFSHQQNAAGRLFPGVALLSPEQDAAVNAEADAEYAACEGHC